MFQAGQIDRGALPAARFVCLLAVTLHAADSNFATFRPEIQRVSHVNVATEYRTGYHRTVAGNREYPVDSHAKQRKRFGQLNVAAEFEQRLSQRLDTLARFRRHGHDRAAFEKRPGEVVFDVATSQFDHVFVNEVDLCQRDQSDLNAEQIHDVEMFARLRHDGVVSRDDQHGHVDARRAGDHVPDETFVTGHIDNADLKIAGSEMCKAQVDRDPASPLFGQTIRVDA